MSGTNELSVPLQPVGKRLAPELRSTHAQPSDSASFALNLFLAQFAEARSDILAKKCQHVHLPVAAHFQLA